MGDSGTSLTFTPYLEGFCEYSTADKPKSIETAAKGGLLKIAGVSTVFVSHTVKHAMTGCKYNVTSWLHPVYHVPGMSQWLLSLKKLLQQGYNMTGDKHHISLYANSGRHLPVMTLHLHTPFQTIYWLKCQIVPGETLMAKSVVHPIDYDVLHKCFGHTSKDPLKHLKASTKNLPIKEVVFPKTDTSVCKGCTEGKMPSRTFSESETRAQKPFDKVHTNLKSFPMQSYHKYNYYVSFYNDYTSCGWITLLQCKSDTIIAIRHFIAMAKTQFGATSLHERQQHHLHSCYSAVWRKGVPQMPN